MRKVLLRAVRLEPRVAAASRSEPAPPPKRADAEILECAPTLKSWNARRR